MKPQCWDIIQYKGKPHIILEFDHLNKNVKVSPWCHSLSDTLLMDDMDIIMIADKLKPNDTVSVKELRKCRILISEEGGKD